MLNRCPNCQAEELVDRLVRQEKLIGRHRFQALVAGQECGHCGETLFEARTLARFDLLVARVLAEAGVDSGEALRFIRKAAGIPAVELATLLDVRPETISRWENDKRPIDRGSYAVLHQLVVDRLAESTATADYLRALLETKKLPKSVKLVVDAA